jgi:hypothetical protein
LSDNDFADFLTDGVGLGREAGEVGAGRKGWFRHRAFGCDWRRSLGEGILAVRTGRIGSPVRGRFGRSKVGWKFGPGETGGVVEVIVFHEMKRAPGRP